MWQEITINYSRTDVQKGQQNLNAWWWKWIQSTFLFAEFWFWIFWELRAEPDILKLFWLPPKVPWKPPWGSMPGQWFCLLWNWTWPSLKWLQPSSTKSVCFCQTQTYHPSVSEPKETNENCVTVWSFYSWLKSWVNSDKRFCFQPDKSVFIFFPFFFLHLQQQSNKVRKSNWETHFAELIPGSHIIRSISHCRQMFILHTCTLVELFQ